MLKKRLTLVIAMMSFSLYGVAEDWTTIIKKIDYEVEVDIDSFNVINGYPYILTRTTFNAPQTYSADSQKIEYIYSVKNMQFNCKEPVFRITSSTLFSAKNKQKASEAFTHTFKPIKQGSDAFSVGQLVCQVHQMVGG